MPKVETVKELIDLLRKQPEQSAIKFYSRRQNTPKCVYIQGCKAVVSEHVDNEPDAIPDIEFICLY